MSTPTDLRLGDCHDLIKSVPDQSIDCIISDPPYGTTAAQWDKLLNYEVLWPEYRRVIKPGGRILVFSAQPFTTMLIASNIREFRHMWFWKKNRPTMHLRAKTQPLRCIEEIAVFGTEPAKGTYNPQMVAGEPYSRNTYRKPSALYKSSTWNHPDHEPYVKEYAERYPTHLLEFAADRPQLVPTQKPLALLEYLVRTHSNEGHTILDPTMGAGTTGLACQNLKRNFIGFEQSPEHFAICQKRLGLA